MEKQREDYLNDYYANEALTRRQAGLKSLRPRVRKFFAYLDEKQMQLLDLRPKDARRYQGWLLETGRKDGKPFARKSVNAYLTAAASFYRYLRSTGILKESPFEGSVRHVSEKKLPAYVLKEEEMDTLLTCLCNFTERSTAKERMAWYRLHVIAELQYATGMRVSEAACLTEDDIDLGRSVVRIREGKGGVERKAFLNEFARGVLDVYIRKVRPLLLTQQNDQALLFGVNQWNLCYAVNSVLEKACLEAGVPKVTSHGFRHAVGYHLLRAGCGVRHIQGILGHRNIRSTEVYTKVDREDLKHVLDIYHPRGGKE